MRETIVGASITVSVFLGLLPIASAQEEALREKILELNKVTGDDVLLAKLRDLIRDGKETLKLLPIAVEMTRAKEKPLTFNTAYLLGRAAHALKEINSAATLYRYALAEAEKLKSAKKILNVYESLIDLYYDNKKYDEAVKLATEMLETAENEELTKMKPFVIERMVQALAKQGKHDEALRLANNLVEDFQGNWYFLRLKGFVLREANRFEEAGMALSLAVERLQRMKDLEEETRNLYIEQLRYTLSSVYVDMKRIDKATKELEALLKLRPDSATYNNDLGYIWADNDMNLDESERLIRKAIDEDRKARKKLLEKSPALAKELDVDNAAYLDSLAWVLYKKKNYAEAKKYMLEAIKLPDGENIELYDHLADIHLALNEKEEAIRVLKKALTLEQTNHREKARAKAIKAKLEGLTAKE